MTAVPSPRTNGYAERLLVDIRLAPPQFVRNFLLDEDIPRLTLGYLNNLPAKELELLGARWQRFSRRPSSNSTLRALPALAELEDEVRPEFLDQESVREMMRGMFFE